jgi:hypothetical protein
MREVDAQGMGKDRKDCCDNSERHGRSSARIPLG